MSPGLVWVLVKAVIGPYFECFEFQRVLSNGPARIMNFVEL